MGIEFSETNLTRVLQQITQELVSWSYVQQDIPEGHVGLLLSPANILQDAEGGNHLIEIQDNPSYAVIQLDQAERVFEYYDLTGTLHTQMEGLQNHKTVKYGYIYYSK